MSDAVPQMQSNEMREKTLTWSRSNACSSSIGHFITIFCIYLFSHCIENGPITMSITSDNPLQFLPLSQTRETIHLSYQRQTAWCFVYAYAWNVPKLFPVYNSYKNGLPRLPSIMSFYLFIVFIILNYLDRTTFTQYACNDNRTQAHIRCDSRVQIFSAFSQRTHALCER